MSEGPRVKCLHCGDVLRSMHVHDYKGCTCRKESKEKVERCADVLKDKLKLDDTDYHLVRCYIQDEFGTGITVDGGGDYLHMSYSTGTSYEILDKEQE